MILFKIYRAIAFAEVVPLILSQFSRIIITSKCANDSLTYFEK